MGWFAVLWGFTHLWVKHKIYKGDDSSATERNHKNDQSLHDTFFWARGGRLVHTQASSLHQIQNLQLQIGDLIRLAFPATNPCQNSSLTNISPISSHVLFTRLDNFQAKKSDWQAMAVRSIILYEVCTDYLFDRWFMGAIMTRLITFLFLKKLWSHGSQISIVVRLLIVSP